MDALAEHRDADALAPPLVRADEAEQLAQRHHEGPRSEIGIRRPGDRLGKDLCHLGRAPQRDARAGLEGDQQHPQRTRALRLRHAVEVEGFGGVAGGLAALPGLRVRPSARRAMACSSWRALW